MTVSILTMNIWNNMAPWSERLIVLREWIERLNPDLIGFQEVLIGEGLDQLDALVEGFGYHCEYGPAMHLPDRPHLEFGNAIASRWPINSNHKLKLPDRGDWEARAALTVEIDSPFGPISFSSTHLHYRFHHGHVREKQVAALADLVLHKMPKKGFPPIIVGDFNAEPESDEIRFMRGMHSHQGSSVAFLDAWEVAGDQSRPGPQGITWSNDNPYAKPEFEPDRRIDYIFVGLPGREGVGHIERCEVVCNRATEGVWPSDHFAVYAELRSEKA